MGEIHPCPKCASMVFIVAPLSPTDAAAPAGAAPAAAGAGLAARLAGLIGRHAVAWSVCGAALVVSGSLAVSLMFGDDQQLAARTDQAATPTETMPADASDSSGTPELAGDSSVEREPIPPVAAEAVDDLRYRGALHTELGDEASELVANLPPLPTLTSDDEDSLEPDDAVASDDQSSMASAVDSSDDNKSKPMRTMRLDPLRFDPSRASLGNVAGRTSAGATREYPSELDDVAANVGATPQAADAVDVATQLAVRLQSVDVPAMTLADFIRMVSEMGAVPIRLDPTTGVSPQTKVMARGQDVTLGELLDGVLAKHGLARIERDSQLVVVKPSAP